VKVLAVALWGFILGGVLLSARAAEIWIDTDVALNSPLRDPDDAFAIAAAAGSPEIHVVGISTSYGNGPLSLVDLSARRLMVEMQLLSNDRIFAGASSANAMAQKSAATEALAASLRKKRLTYVALAPLTNLAAFLVNHPKEMHRIERVIFVGGQMHPGKIRVGPYHFHDANVLKDPMAVRRVLQSQVPLILVPPEIAGHLRLRRHDFTGLGSRTEFLRRSTSAWRWFWNSFADKNGGPVFDAAAVLAATDRTLVRLENGTASLDRDGQLSINSTTPTPADRSITFVAALAPVAAKRSLLRRLSRGTQP
jgi:inosine-uridine nucleoside N-ribohydrolase